MAHLWLTVLLMLLATTTLEARVVEPTLLEMATTRTGHLMQATRVSEKGPYDVTTVTVRKSRPPAPPLPLLLVSPNTTGVFPVILFFHGMLLQNTDYSDLFKHTASHGYVIVAPLVNLLGCILYKTQKTSQTKFSSKPNSSGCPEVNQKRAGPYNQASEVSASTIQHHMLPAD